MDVIKRIKELNAVIPPEHRAAVEALALTVPGLKVLIPTPGTESRLNGVLAADISALIREMDEGAQARRERLREQLSRGPGNPQLVKLLAECVTIESTSRIELGRRYAAMKEIVDTKQAGKDEDSKYWTWGRWAARYIPRSRSSIKQCIADYRNSLANGHDLANSHPENVVSFPGLVR